MSTAPLPGYAELADALRALETGLEPAELHGSLCGWLAGGFPTTTVRSTSAATR